MAQKCQTKLSFTKQNFLLQNKTFFYKTKLSFMKQNFILKITFSLKIKLSFWKQNFLFGNKTFFLEIIFLFTKQNSLLLNKTKLSFALLKCQMKQTNFLFKATLVPLVSSKTNENRVRPGAILRLLRKWCCYVLRIL